MPVRRTYLNFQDRGASSFHKDSQKLYFYYFKLFSKFSHFLHHYSPITKVYLILLQIFYFIIVNGSKC